MFSGGYDLKVPQTGGSVDVCTRPDISDVLPAGTTPALGTFTDLDICAGSVDYARGFCQTAEINSDAAHCAADALDDPPTGSPEKPLRQYLASQFLPDDFPRVIALLKKVIAGAPPAVCGDSTITLPEQCDDGNTDAWDGCDNCQKKAAECGNGHTEPGERCDDGGEVDGDGCSRYCQNEPPPSVCGNNRVETGEECDDHNTNNDDGCSSTCQNETPAVCGNGAVESGEQCDEGDTDNGDGCSSTCQDEAPPPSSYDGFSGVFALSYVRSAINAGGLYTIYDNDGSELGTDIAGDEGGVSRVLGGARFTAGIRSELGAGFAWRIGLYTQDLLLNRLTDPTGNKGPQGHLTDFGLDVTCSWMLGLKHFFIEPEVGVYPGIIEFSWNAPVVLPRSGARDIKRWPGVGMGYGLTLGGIFNGSPRKVGFRFNHIYSNPLNAWQIPPGNTDNGSPRRGVDFFNLPNTFLFSLVLETN